MNDIQDMTQTLADIGFNVLVFDDDVEREDYVIKLNGIGVEVRDGVIVKVK